MRPSGRTVPCKKIRYVRKGILVGRLPLLKQAECVLCDVVINRENDSNEHIIPNAIGGKKVVRAFICRNCNSTSGHAWDTELVKQLHPLCVLLNIQRSRGVVPKLSVKSSKGRTLIDRAENSHQPFRRREGAMARFRDIKTLQKFASVHASIHNHFNHQRHLTRRDIFK